MKRILIIIPARKGSKGLPNKNTKLMGDKPLISYSIDFAMKIKSENDVICVSTNDEDVISIAAGYDLEIPFKRPENLTTDTASMNDVLLHAVDFYESKGQSFDLILLLQPTSPFRNIEDFKNVIESFDDECDMVVTVKKVKENPYFTLFEENEQGYLSKSKEGNFQTRQECPPVYAYNGSMYLIRISSLRKRRINELEKIKKVIMPDERSIDIDNMQDWVLAEYFLSESLVSKKSS